MSSVRPGIGSRIFVFGFALSALLLSTHGDVLASNARLGIRAGYTEMDGTLYDLDLEPGDMALFGFHVIFPFLSDRLAFQIAGEGTSSELELTRDGLDDASRGKVDWQDLALYTSLRAELLPPGLLGFYVGGGVGVHLTELDQDQLVEALEDARDDIQDELDGSSSDLEWHGLAGVALGLGSTFEVFGEGRYRRVEGDLQRDGFAGYVGLNIRLP
ncbi:MAG: hypothetical protein R3E97_08745 [Candidatus Eisenbacteria bacterium]